MARARHEAGWTTDGSRIRGNPNRNRWWILLVCAAVIAGVSWWGYGRFMNFQDISYEVRFCDRDLSEDSTFAEVSSAGCTPAPVDGMDLQIREERSLHQYDRIDGSAFVFEGFPVNTPAHAPLLTGAPAASSILLVDVDQERVVDAMAPNADGSEWSGYTGSRGGTHYWILITPEG